jgi:hypothetical protein
MRRLCIFFFAPQGVSVSRLRRDLSARATWAVPLILVAMSVLTMVAILSTRQTAARPMRA